MKKIKNIKGISTRHNPSVRIKNATAGITLIALVVTIIVLIILAGVSISLILGQNGLIDRAKSENEKYAEQAAKEKLEIALADLYTEKTTNPEYTEDIYLTTKLEDKGFIVNDEIITVDDYQFAIDRTKLKITEELGKASEETLLKPRITSFNVEEVDKVITARVTLKNTEGITLKYEIRKQGEDTVIETSGDTSNLSYPFTKLDTGTYVVTVVASNEYGTSTKEKTIIINRLVEEINISETTITLNPNGIKELNYTILPEDATNKNVKWTSSNENVAKVENGKITAIGEGIAIITIEALDGSGTIATCKVISAERQYLYQNGNEFTDITGGYTAIFQSGEKGSSPNKLEGSGKKVEYNSDNIGIYCSTGSYVGIKLHTNNKIDFEKYSTFNIKWSISNKAMSTYNKVRINLWSEVGNTFTSVSLYKMLYETGPRNNAIEIMSFDISDVEDEYYLGIESNSSTGVHIYEMWLE